MTDLSLWFYESGSGIWVMLSHAAMFIAHKLHRWFNTETLNSKNWVGEKHIWYILVDKLRIFMFVYVMVFYMLIKSSHYIFLLSHTRELSVHSFIPSLDSSLPGSEPRHDCRSVNKTFESHLTPCGEWPQSLQSHISHHRQEAKRESHQHARSCHWNSPKFKEMYE